MIFVKLISLISALLIILPVILPISYNPMIKPMIVIIFITNIAIIMIEKIKQRLKKTGG